MDETLRWSSTGQMKKCKACGQESWQAAFCKSCGAPLNDPGIFELSEAAGALVAAQEPANGHAASSVLPGTPAARAAVASAREAMSAPRPTFCPYTGRSVVVPPSPPRLAANTPRIEGVQPARPAAIDWRSREAGLRNA